MRDATPEWAMGVPLFVHDMPQGVISPVVSRVSAEVRARFRGLTLFVATEAERRALARAEGRGIDAGSVRHGWWGHGSRGRGRQALRGGCALHEALVRKAGRRRTEGRKVLVLEGPTLHGSRTPCFCQGRVWRRGRERAGGCGFAGRRSWRRGAKDQYWKTRRRN